ncbi:MAG: hypothetical protein NC231_10990 [Bacillus sp. (in: Bacteria)]|nr:hypothetical protein [Bacillus sp. (in: firmicutes)]MCM1427324.1 hypothetical protein [Eubacterium sp.]
MSDTPLESTKVQPIQIELGMMPKQELDEPLDSNVTSDKILPKELEISEKDKVRKEKRYFSAIWLLIGCLVFLGLIYSVETYICYKLGKYPNSHTNGIIEIIKTLLFTLSGYLFARKENGD